MNKVMVGGLVYDEDKGEGVIHIVGEFYEENTITQLDMLQDWIDSLISCYNEIIADYEKKH